MALKQLSGSKAPDGSDYVVLTDGAGNLGSAGGGGSGSAAVDDAAFTVASDSGTPMMGVVTTDSVSSGDVGVVGMLTNRQLKVTLYDAAGTELAVGGGTQYTEDAAAAANPVGNALIAVRNDGRTGSLVTTDGDNIALRGSNSGELYTLDANSAAISSATSRLTSSATNIAAGSPLATTSFVVGSRYNSTPPTFTNGQEGALQIDSAGRLITAPLVAGTNNIGDVDVLTVPADPFGANADAAATAGSTGSIQAKLRLMTSQLDAIKTSVETIDNTVSGSELQVDIVSGGSSGVQYTEGDVDTTITGNALLWEDAGNTLAAASVGKPLPTVQTGALPAGTNNIGDVDILTVPADPFGANADAAATAGSTGSIQAKLRLMTSQLDAIKTSVETIDNTVSGSELQVDIVSGGSSGVQYTEGDVDTTITGNALLWEDAGNTLVAASAAKPIPTVQTGALPAGTNNIGDVDVLTVPADPFGANADAAATAGSTGSIQAKLRLMTSQLDAIKTSVETIDNTVSGSELQVDIVSGGSSGVQYTEGDVDATITGNALMWEDAGNAIVSASVAKPLPTVQTGAIPAGTNNIGDVDVLTVPADPFGVNADAASATGSLSAKLRGIATALGVTAQDLGVGTGGSRTQRVAVDSSQIPTAGQTTASGSVPVVPASDWTQGVSAAVSLTRTADTNAYAANDVIGAATGSTAALTFASMGPSAGRVLLTSVELMIHATAVPSGMTSFRLHLYNITPPSAYGDNVAWDLLTGDRASYLGYVDLGTPVDLGGSLYVQTLGVNKQVKLSGTSLFGYLTTIGGFTPASATVKMITLNGVVV